MGFIIKLIKYIFISSLILCILLFLFKIPLPRESMISDTLINNYPVQTSISEEAYFTDFKDQKYKITPLYDYEIYGLVVSDYDSENWMDVMHKNDPAQTKDLCLVWGDNLKDGVYRDLKYKHGEFTCFYSWKGKLDHEFFPTQLSNNHLIPANNNLAKLVKKSAVGDQVYIKGKLVNYEIYNKEGITSSRNTSTIREDSSCEIIYVEDFKIISQWGSLFRGIRNFFLFLTIASGGLGLAFLLI